MPGIPMCSFPHAYSVTWRAVEEFFNAQAGAWAFCSSGGAGGLPFCYVSQTVVGGGGGCSVGSTSCLLSMSTPLFHLSPAVCIPILADTNSQPVYCVTSLGMVVCWWRPSTPNTAKWCGEEKNSTSEKAASPEKGRRNRQDRQTGLPNQGGTFIAGWWAGHGASA